MKLCQNSLLQYWCLWQSTPVYMGKYWAYITRDTTCPSPHARVTRVQRLYNSASIWLRTQPCTTGLINDCWVVTQIRQSLLITALITMSRDNLLESSCRLGLTGCYELTTLLQASCSFAQVQCSSHHKTHKSQSKGRKLRKSQRLTCNKRKTIIVFISSR